MKIILKIGIFIMQITSLQAQGLKLPENDPYTQDSRNSAPVPDITNEESAVPPAGGFKKYYLRDLRFVRDQLLVTMAKVPEDVKETPAFAKVENLRAALDQVLASAMKSDYFVVIDRLKEIELLPDEPWLRLSRISHSAGTIGYSMKFVVAKHIEETNGVVSTSELESFIWLHASGNFDGPSDWEGEEPPIDAAGIMILDPNAVVTNLKTMPYFKSHIFLNSETAVEAFARYGPAGSGNSVLKTLFAANSATAIAKWNELAEWLAEQKEAEQN